MMNIYCDSSSIVDDKVVVVFSEHINSYVFKILSTVSKSFSASDSLTNEPERQLLMLIVSEYTGKLPIRLIPL